MEENLDKCLEEIHQLPNVIGVMYADRQGLCLGAKGHASNESAGIIAAIADQAAKLEPNSKPPVVLLESETKAHEPWYIPASVPEDGILLGALHKTVGSCRCLDFKHLRETYMRSGEEGVRLTLGISVNGKPKVTTRKKIVDAIVKCLQDLLK